MVTLHKYPTICILPPSCFCLGTTTGLSARRYRAFFPVCLSYLFWFLKVCFIGTYVIDSELTFCAFYVWRPKLPGRDFRVFYYVLNDFSWWRGQIVDHPEFQLSQKYNKGTENVDISFTHMHTMQIYSYEYCLLLWHISNVWRNGLSR